MGKAWQEHEHTATTLNQEREKIRALYRAVILQALTDIFKTLFDAKRDRARPGSGGAVDILQIAGLRSRVRRCGISRLARSQNGAYVGGKPPHERIGQAERRRTNAAANAKTQTRAQKETAKTQRPRRLPRPAGRVGVKNYLHNMYHIWYYTLYEYNT